MAETFLELDFTSLEARDLLAAVSRHCTCTQHDQAGTIECASHRSLSEQSDLKRLLFARRMKALWRSAEFDLSSRPAA
jgi:hypothetical protein